MTWFLGELVVILILLEKEVHSGEGMMLINHLSSYHLLLKLS